MLRRVVPTVSCRSVAAKCSTRITATTTASALFARRFATFDVVVPGLGGESVKSGKIASVDVKVGDSVPEDTILATIESDKSTVEVRADKSGVVKEIAVSEGDTVEVGAKVAVIDEQKVEKKKRGGAAPPSSGDSPSQPKPDEAPAADDAPEPKSAEKTAASSSSSSSGKQPQQQQQQQPAATAAPSKGGSRDTYTKPISTMRARIAERLKGSQNENAMLTTFNEIDCTNLINLRYKYKDQFEKKHGVKFGLMSPFLKAAAHALMEVPVVNASWGKGVVEYRDFVDISVAVATPKGLVVPVMRNIEQMSYADIEKKLQEFSNKAMQNKITPDDMAGGTFTVSNGGTFGSWMGTPIINPPQSAILGMHAIKKKPWVDEKDQIVVRQIMAVALTYDHRLIDGRDAVTFLVKIKNVIEDPTRLLLDLA